MFMKQNFIKLLKFVLYFVYIVGRYSDVKYCFMMCDFLCCFLCCFLLFSDVSTVLCFGMKFDVVS